MDKTRRAYHLSASGRRSLQRAIRRNKPWRYSTGPRTEAGKLRGSANAITDGEFIKNTRLIRDPLLAAIFATTAMVGCEIALLEDRHDRLSSCAKKMLVWIDRLVELGDPDGVARDLKTQAERIMRGIAT